MYHNRRLTIHQTPAQSRFLLSKRRAGGPSQSQVEDSGTGGNHQFRSTPRFSSTPRPIATQGPQFSTPSVLTSKSKTPLAASLQDIIDSSQLSPESSQHVSPGDPNVPSLDGAEADSSFASQSTLGHGADKVV